MSTAAAFEPITARAVHTALSTRAFGRSLHVFDEAPSTNTVAADFAQRGAPHGTVVVADAQSAGRGRLGRRWHSPAGKNLYCSIVLRPHDLAPASSAWVPLVAATAVARTVQVLAALRPSLKWPNDVLIESRKIAGLLCERTGGGAGEAVIVIGIGVNVNARPEAFPDDLRDRATSMAIEAGRPFDRAVVLAALLGELEIRYERLASGQLADMIEEYRLRCGTIGRRVRVALGGDQAVEGVAQGITAEGALRVTREPPAAGTGPGAFVDIHAGDVVHLR